MIDDKGTTQGDVILERLGFTLNGEPYGYEWVWWSVLFCIGLCIMSIIASVFFLNHVRYATGKAAVGGTATEEEEEEEKKADNSSSNIAIPVKGATLTFKDVHYTVKASTTNDKIELLKGVSGYFASGKMTALMGSSGEFIVVKLYDMSKMSEVDCIVRDSYR